VNFKVVCIGRESAVIYKPFDAAFVYCVAFRVELGVLNYAYG